MTTSVVEYSATEAALADLANRFKGIVFDVSNKEGMDEAKKARAEIRGYRTSLETKRVEIKAPALARCREIDSEAKRITDALVALEDPIDALIKKEEGRKEAEKNAKIRAEQERLAAEERARKEAEEARLAEARAEIARQRAELDRAEQERIEAEKQVRLRIEEAERAARLRIEEDERKARAVRDEADRQARIARDAEEARLKKERDRIDTERRAIEDRQRQERDAEEEKQREIQRRKNEITDGYEMLTAFVTRFGDLEEFRAVAQAINQYLRKAA